MAFKIISIVCIFALFLVDMYWSSKSTSLASASIRLVALVGCAAIFGWILTLSSLKDSLNFFSGYITEYSLSIDNLFVYGLILDSFKVPDALSDWVLSIGIFLAVLIRLGLIVLGSSLLSAFSFLFIPCGILLIWVSVKNVVSFWKKKEGGGEGGIIKKLSRFLPTGDWEGKKLWYKKSGKLLFSPLLLTFLSIGLCDAFFSLDSIPAILGITTNIFVVFTSNFFALIGLKELYSLLKKGLRALKFLPLGVSAILAFIGVKLFFEALSDNSLKFINGGRPLPIPQIPSWVTLCVIASILMASIGFSLAFLKKDKESPKGKIGKEEKKR
ncbi:MAG: TerC family protein [Aeriscardovia sp.]|nr:TerC family protein [Aeriscardovia sp.]